MLMRENAGLVSNSVTAEHLLNGGRRISAPEMTRVEPELGMRGKKGLVSSGVAAAGSSCGESMTSPMRSRSRPPYRKSSLGPGFWPGYTGAS